MGHVLWCMSMCQGYVVVHVHVFRLQYMCSGCSVVLHVFRSQCCGTCVQVAVLWYMSMCSGCSVVVHVFRLQCCGACPCVQVAVLWCMSMCSGCSVVVHVHVLWYMCSGCSVVVHGAASRDVTLQLTSLTQVLLDWHCRTMAG